MGPKDPLAWAKRPASDIAAREVLALAKTDRRFASPAGIEFMRICNGRPNEVYRRVTPAAAAVYAAAIRGGIHKRRQVVGYNLRNVHIRIVSLKKSHVRLLL